MNSKYIIDGHSHIGQDIFHGKSDIDDYMDFAKKTGINVGLIMGVPSPCVDLSDIQSRQMYWKYFDDRINYYGKTNPYMKLNYELNELLQERTSEGLQLFFIPMLHPILDKVSDFEKLIIDTDPVAIKIHGIGSGTGPRDINADFIKLIKKYQLPIIVHTDCDFGKGSISMQYIRNINNAKKWTEFFINNGIYGVLNHGASLDKDVFELVNKSKFVKIALGPDKIACKDKNRLHIDCFNYYKNYLLYMKNNLDHSKIIYDADFNWNVEDGVEDISSVDRVKEVFEDADMILSENIIEHYPKLKRKLRRL